MIAVFKGWVSNIEKKGQEMLRVLFGNNWGGRMQENLRRFVREIAQSHQVLAFTEVNNLESRKRTPIYITNGSDFSKGLHDQVMINQFGVLQGDLAYTHEGYFAAENAREYRCATQKVVYPETEYGNALFVNTEPVEILETGVIFVLGSFNERLGNGASSRALQYVVLRYEGQTYIIAHFHGVWYKDPKTGSTKSDGPIRVTQSANVSSALEQLAVQYAGAKVIFGGDFNLDLDTVVLRMLEQGTVAGNLQYRNLIKEHGIVDTRTPLSRDYDTAGVSLYADYVFVSKDVEVHELRLLGHDVSDHTHLSLAFS